MSSFPSKDPRTDLDARLEAEIEAALGDMSLEEMLTLEEQAGDAGRGAGGEGTQGRGADRESRRGRVVAIRGDDVFVEFGPKSQGVCSLSQFESNPEIGTDMEFVVERFDKEDGLLVLSRHGAVQKARWDALDVGQVVEGRVTGVNKGGLEVEIASHQAFMPAGQVDLRHIDDLEVFVGEKIACEIIELDRMRGRIIVSRKNVLAEERQRTREKLLEELKVGEERPGVVTSIQPYGAFVDLGGVDGLAHISDLSYKRINTPREVVKEGDQITVKVLKIEGNDDDLRIGLGLKQTMADPFQSTSQELEEGGTVTGRVTKIVDFGAFIEISPGVEGLIHISELSQERVNRVEQVVKPDEIVTVKILSVDRDRQRISLSLKALRGHAEDQPRKADASIEKLKARFGGFEDLKGGLG